jgi:signal transduction histidine kinase
MRSHVDLNAERLSLALAAARMGDFRWDAQTDSITFSARAADLAGVAVGVPLTRERAAALVHPDDYRAVEGAIERATRERGEYSIQHRFVGTDRERWVKSSGRPIFDEQGQLLGIVGVLQDITADRFLILVDNAVRALSSAEQITFCAARMLGEHVDADRCAYCFVEDDEDTFTLTGNYTRGVHSIVGTYRFRQFGAECLRLMRAGLPYAVQDSACDPRIDEDDRRAYELTAIRGVVCVPISKAGRFVAAMAVHTSTPRVWQPEQIDIVQQVASRCWESIERARIEAERQQLLEAAQTANRAKDEFLAMLGHELRNPLAPICTALELMKLRGERASERERIVIERQVAHLNLLVDDLLDVSRIARGLIELRLEPVELSDIVARALEIASPLLAKRAHTVITGVAEQGLMVEGDVARLTQIVSNLLTNAAKYTPPGGSINIAAEARGGEVLLRVSDTGIGMTPDVLASAFDTFVQGRQGVDRAQGGLGLGLSIVRSLTVRHGGSVHAESDGMGRGSTLTVRLPRVEGDRTATRSVARPASPSRRSENQKNVLVVDDNEDAATLLAEALACRGHQVRLAHDAVAALRLAADQAFDVALLDIGLPVMDGYELAGRLRALRHLTRVSLVAVTGYGQDTDRRKALAAGFHHHLVKPVNLTVLNRIVDETVS